jgi:Tol biopolymer transport system component
MYPETRDRRQITSAPNGYLGDFGPTFSPDGKTLAFVRSPTVGNGSIDLLSISGSGEPQSEPRRLALDEPWVGGFDWTSDGRSIVFSSGQPGGSNLWTIAASGGTPERLVGGENATDVSISRTGRLLSLEVKALKTIFFTGALTVSTFSAHPHSGSQALRGEFLFLRLAMYFDSSYAIPSFQQRNRIRCHLNANARSAA